MGRPFLNNAPIPPASRYDLELWTVPGPVRSGLKMALEEHTEIKAILMGTRRSDPHAANLQAFQVHRYMIYWTALFTPRIFYSAVYLSNLTDF